MGEKFLSERDFWSKKPICRVARFSPWRGEMKGKGEWIFVRISRSHEIETVTSLLTLVLLLTCDADAYSFWVQRWLVAALFGAG